MRMCLAEQRTFDEMRMLECLTLAKGGAGFVSPNPMVGAVIVKNGKIVGRGDHRKFGGTHAEVFALRQAGGRARGATLYVNLEPCCHFGKTPPCTDTIIRAKITSVVIGTRDPNPIIAGRGIQKLRRAGVRVEVGVLEEECRNLNEVFFKFITKKIPFVVVKVAQTLDGHIADSEGNSKWITNIDSRQLVHSLRARYDAVLVGAKTIAKDNPRLTVRNLPGRNPFRIVLDGKLTSPMSAKIFRDRDRKKTIIFTSTKSAKRKVKDVRKLRKAGVQVLEVHANDNLRIFPRQILRQLAKMNIASILVEGGTEVFTEFIAEKSTDKIIFFVSPKLFGSGLKAFSPKSQSHIASMVQLQRVHSWNMHGDIVIEGYLHKK